MEMFGTHWVRLEKSCLPTI
ncbi:unnamed protein product [Acanthoscelides obtectus]|uniref:Uncharacterized protein n=1 Tax=Acanthoscelides obtectus TaxID=200917 RepID=A0A9P0MFZ7_ACAOB|nr:unnamed protein product [Acanthoscelides obtectus]CAK1652153.1 hypothetical protein AOBTE_LOCUS17715 [Acanthoscelides obtectus]